MTQEALNELKARACDNARQRREQLEQTKKETKKRTDETLKMAESRSITANFAEKVAKLFYESNERVNNGKALVTIVFNPNDKGWVLLRSYWENCEILPIEYFKRDEEEKIFDLVKADFDAIGLGICEKHVYDGEMIVFKAFVKED